MARLVSILLLALCSDMVATERNRLRVRPTRRGTSLVHASATSALNESSVAFDESFGFIDESPERWNLRKKIHLAELAKEKQIHDLFSERGNKGRVWWQYHHEPSFHCEFAQRVGNVGDGGKWMCDPHLVAQRVKAGAPCLVYSVGSHGQFDFEQRVQDTIGKECEIHIFDPAADYEKQMPPNMFYHAYPLGAHGQSVDGVPAKTMSEVAKELGHEGKRLDMFKIDCEGCEWDTFHDWLDSGLDIQQIMVELHWRDNAHRVQEFYQALQDKGYVIFSKEPNTEGCGGDCIEYSFLKLSPTFSKV